MDVLFLHQNFPAQFVHVASALKIRRGCRPMAITDAANTRPDLVPTLRYRVAPGAGGRPNALAAHFSDRAARGEAAGRAMLALRARGFDPGLVIGHPGWGETLFVKDVWPRATLVAHAEYWYGAAGADVGFDPEFEAERSDIDRFAVRARNAALALALADADWGVTPTRWQGDRFPPAMRNRIAVLHEGIDTALAAPDASARFTVPGTALPLAAGDEVVTFVNRNLEPYRGFHAFMRALPAVLAARPRARAVIVGGDEVSYGRKPTDGRPWREALLDEVGHRLPLDRVHFVGRLPYRDLLDLLRVSAAHVYLTYPFVLSWSMLDAMSVGALVIGSRTGPVEEVIRHGENGLLVDFFDTAGIANLVVQALAEPARFVDLRAAARATVVGTYDLRRVCLPKWLAFLNGVTRASNGQPVGP